MKQHREIAEYIGEDDKYLKRFEKLGWTKKREIDSERGFSIMNPNMSNVKIEEYKASIHSPSLFNLPKDGDKRKIIEEFNDEEIMKVESPEDFDSEMNAAIISRKQQLKRKERHALAPRKQRMDYSDEEDMEIR